MILAFHVGDFAAVAIIVSHHRVCDWRDGEVFQSNQGIKERAARG